MPQARNNPFRTTVAFSWLLLLLLLSVAAAMATALDSSPDQVEQLIVEHVRRVLVGNSSSSDHSRKLGDRRHRRHRRQSVGGLAATMLRGSGSGGDAAPAPDVPFGVPSMPPPPPPPPLPPLPAYPQLQTGCAWSVTVTAATYNVAFPDLNCVYQVLLYWGLSGKTALRIEGQFPRVRYFSFQSYDVASGQPLASLVDYEIEPHTGLNPFQEAPHWRGGEHDDGEAAEPTTGTYHVHLTDTGDHGLENELAATSAGTRPRRRCRGKECLTLVIMRLYTAEPGEDAFRGSGSEYEGRRREWGYAPPPVVSIRHGTQVNRRTGRTTVRSKMLPPCDPHKNTLAKSFLDWKVPQLQHDWTDAGGTPLDNEDDNFIVYTPASSSRALFANADANYLFATAKNNRTHEGKQLVARITGHLPTVARGFAQYPRIADWDDYEARYVSLSTIALKGAGPVVDTVMDATIEQQQLARRRGAGIEEEEEDDEETLHHSHHHHHHHHYPWKARDHDADPRGFSVVAAPSPEFLEGCPPQVYRGERDLFLTTVERGALYPPTHLAFLYRQILSQWQTSGRQDRSIARAKHECLGRREEGLCHLRSFFIDLMGPQYPRIKYFYCWRNVTQGCSCEDASGKAVLWELTPEPDPEPSAHEEEAGWGYDFDDFFHEHHHKHRHRPDEEDDDAEWDEWWPRSVSEMRGNERGNGSTSSSSGGSSNVTVALTNTTSSNGTTAAAASADSNSSKPIIHVNCSDPCSAGRGRPAIIPLHRGRLVDGMPNHTTKPKDTTAVAIATKKMDKEEV